MKAGTVTFSGRGANPSRRTRRRAPSEITLSEVQEYAAQLAKKRRLFVDVVLMVVAALPVSVVERTVYRSSILEAKRCIGRRDPDDVEILALALHTNTAVWSNDNDFEGVGVEWLTTTELLARFGGWVSTQPWSLEMRFLGGPKKGLSN